MKRGQRKPGSALDWVLSKIGCHLVFGYLLSKSQEWQREAGVVNDVAVAT